MCECLFWAFFFLRCCCYFSSSHLVRHICYTINEVFLRLQSVWFSASICCEITMLLPLCIWFIFLPCARNWFGSKFTNIKPSTASFFCIYHFVFFLLIEISWTKVGNKYTVWFSKLTSLKLNCVATNCHASLLFVRFFLFKNRVCVCMLFLQNGKFLF